MRTRIFALMAFALFAGSNMMAQTLDGGGGILHVTGDPDLITITGTVTVNESNVAYDRAANTLYFYNPAGTAGDRWDPVTVGSLTDTDTRLDNPRNDGAGNLVFDILDVINSSDLGDVTIAITDLVDLTEGDGIIITESNGAYTIAADFVAGNGITLTTAGSGQITIASDGTGTVINDGNSVVVSGDGSAGNPYIPEITNFAGATAGQIPVKDGTGSITWQDFSSAIQDITTDANSGKITVTMEDGVTTVDIDMSNAPTVQTYAELQTAADALASGETGIAVAAPGNILGMPAGTDGTNGTTVGVLFLLEKN